MSLIFILLITAIINFINFMDGLDGLVAGCGIIIMASTSSWAISGAILGFLFWNWSPAKVFMGDVGSTFIGAVFGGMLVQVQTYQESFVLLLTCFPLLADALVCVIRRFLNGENIFEAHRKHLFQRLQQAGWSHQNVSILYISAVGFLAMCSHLSIYLPVALAIVLLTGIYLDRYIATSFVSS
jgi:UDP-N-acetylmuramyl pentapeptide phosphotransferase/UDP-N-acetylglucosamine-1-phosphate transferase